MMKIDIDWETLDKITLSVLYDSYRGIQSDLAQGGLHEEDIMRYEELLDALHVVCGYFDIERVAEEKLKKIDREVLNESVNTKYRNMLKGLRGNE